MKAGLYLLQVVPKIQWVSNPFCTQNGQNSYRVLAVLSAKGLIVPMAKRLQKTCIYFLQYAYANLVEGLIPCIYKCYSCIAMTDEE